MNVRTRYEGAGELSGPNRFLVRSPLGEPLLEVEIPVAALEQVRAAWRRGVMAVSLGVLAVTLLLLCGPVLDRRLRERTPWRYLRATLVAMGLVLGARLLLRLAIPAPWSGGSLFTAKAYASALVAPLLRSPLDFLETALTLVALVAILAPAIAQLRVRRRRRPIRGRGALAVHLVAGLLLAGLLAGHQLFLHDAVNNTSVNTLRFSLHPWDPTRLALISGLVFFEAANLWASALVAITALALTRPPRNDWRAIGGVLAAWLLPVAAVAAIALRSGWPVPALAVAAAAASVAGAAWFAGRAIAWFRHASQATRLVAMLGTLVGPALLLYPAILYHTEAAKRQLIETDYAVQPARHPQVLEAALQQSKRRDRRHVGPRRSGPRRRRVARPEHADRERVPHLEPDGARPPAADLRGRDLRPQRRSAEPLRAEPARVQPRSRRPRARPAAGGRRSAWPCRSAPRSAGCCTPSGASASRPTPGSRLMRVVGTIVVQVMLDYRTLPFLSTQGPYMELFRGASTPYDESARGADVELVIYGWGQLPIYTSGTGAWPLDEALFDRIYRSRTPFWTTLPKAGRVFHVYISNDRYGIYALGYPVLTVADHLERMAELTTLAGAIFVVLLAGSAIFARIARDRARLGAVLLREIRASFYRKLFLAFVLASIVPVLTLAVVARTYFATKLRADVEAEAARSASVAQRVIEEFAALPQRGAETFAPLNDDLMVLISQVLNQDVNIFEGPRLIATSERDLFASGLLPQRTPSEVYRAIRLQRLPSFVGEDTIANVRYMLAASPVRIAGHDAILTVPQALRQQEIEREIDELNRGVLLAALIFILLGAAIGLSMAERIADPVRRLTRATQRIARGDFDARILVRSADELQRLVDAFNAMAAELKTQAVQLERTHRLEAWAEMARQVAHEIKNPLTPIQLSAEHLRRVHADRGKPLSPVLESCVESILNQVRLLRQISAEFSAFATAPAPRPAPVAVADLVGEVLGPYRAGLSDRIALDVDLDRRPAADPRGPHARRPRHRERRRERAARHARRGHACRCARAATAPASPWKSPTPASAWTPRRSRGSSSPTSRRGPRARGWGSPSRSGTSRRAAGGSRWTASGAAGRPSGCGCRRWRRVRDGG